MPIREVQYDSHTLEGVSNLQVLDLVLDSSSELPCLDCRTCIRSNHPYVYLCSSVGVLISTFENVKEIEIEREQHCSDRFGGTLRTPRLQTHPTPMMSARTCHVITCVLVTDVRTHSALWTLLALFLEIFQHLVLVTELSPILDFDTSTR